MNGDKASGNKFHETIYQRSFALEFQEQSICYVRELAVPLFYKGKPVGKRRVEFIVKANVLVELKTVSEIADIHINQI